MSELLNRSLQYAKDHGVTVIPVPGSYDATATLILVAGHAYLGLTEGTIQDPMLGEIVWRACESLGDAQRLEIRIDAQASSAA